jgi:hypothetical protein
MKPGDLVRAASIIRPWSLGDSYYLPDGVPEGAVGVVVGQSSIGWNIIVGEEHFKDIPTLNLEVINEAR